MTNTVNSFCRETDCIFDNQKALLAPSTGKKKAKGPENVDKMRIINATQYPVFDPGDRLVEKLVKI